MVVIMIYYNHLYDPKNTLFYTFSSYCTLGIMAMFLINSSFIMNPFLPHFVKLTHLNQLISYQKQMSDINQNPKAGDYIDNLELLNYYISPRDAKSLITWLELRR